MNLEHLKVVQDSLADEVHISFVLGTKLFRIEVDTDRETVELEIEEQ